MTARRELALVAAGAVVLTVAMTYPLAFKLGHVARIDNGDGQFAVWNVAWVARTLVVDPVHVFDANIFYPHRGTLAYSEANLGAGILALPTYWLTRNPYAALNIAILCGFVLSAIGMYFLVRYLTRDRRAAVISAIAFAFCPYIFAHSAQIQLQMVAGLPFSMLAFHRIADRPTAGRGAALGAALAAQALFCGYYEVFVLLAVGYAIVVVASTRGYWTAGRFWMAMTVAALVTVALVLPMFVPYLRVQRAGFSRSLELASSFRATWSTYFASAAYAHTWLLLRLPAWGEVAFPGMIPMLLGIAGFVIAARRRGELALLYGGLAVLAAWASFGPPAGLYTLMYRTVPLFEWLRAPARFGLMVTFTLDVLAGVAASYLLPATRRGTVAAAIVSLALAAELCTPSPMREVLPPEPVYRVLAREPAGPVIEMPFFYLDYMFPRHTNYMLESTVHWMPLVNGYSDFIPQDFRDHVLTLAPFPSRDAFRLLEPLHIRYAVFHMHWYNVENQNDVIGRLKQFAPYLRLIYADRSTRLYEIVGFPR
ncbi:MAG: hypothetical protein DMG00_09925 [Acidobacteria bacterium]|nr:MAG: hypothetical protein DMG00_09925 [Acidobacteriota bacterium]